MFYYSNVCLCSQWKHQCCALLALRVKDIPPLWIMLEMILAGGHLAIFLRSYFLPFVVEFSQNYLFLTYNNQIKQVSPQMYCWIWMRFNECGKIGNTVATEEMYISEKLFNRTSVIPRPCKWFLYLLRGCILWRFGSRRPFHSFWPRSVHICRDLSECMSKPGCAGRQPVCDFSVVTAGCF